MASPVIPETVPSGSSSSTQQRISWCLRDAAKEIQDRRQAMLHRTATTAKPLYSCKFDFSQRDRSIFAYRHKLSYVFDLAAGTVIEAVRAGDSTSSKDTVKSNISAVLPKEFEHCRLLQQARVESLYRSHENREYAKRKGIKSPVVPKDTGPTPETKASPTKNNSSTSPKEEKSQDSSSPRKFSRNTPASSAAALDGRFTSTRAILCAAGNVALASATPGPELDMLDVPQKKEADKFNMGEVAVEAQTVSQRTVTAVENAVHRATLRSQYRMDKARCDEKAQSRGFLRLSNPFDRSTVAAVVSDEEEIPENETTMHNPQTDAITEFWRSKCLPRFTSILEKGPGHAVYFDLQWSNRHGRIAHLLKSRAEGSNNFGPHLIVTTIPEINSFAQEFCDLNAYLGLLPSKKSSAMRVLTYQGSTKQRRRLRKYLPQASGLPDSPCHIILISYSTFLDDYLHFCQLPFDSVILDEGLGWLAAAHGDQNSSLRNIWDTAIFSTSDQHVGMAGTSFRSWDFDIETFSEADLKNAWVGLTARHRIVTTSTLSTQQRVGTEAVPVSVSALVTFLFPHFADVVREEWDRSRISSDTESMNHFRRLVARSVIVHTEQAGVDNLHDLSADSLCGKFVSDTHSIGRPVPRIIADTEFVSSGKVASSRRSVLAWLGPPETSWLRYELGSANLLSILDAMKLSDHHGYVCEEVTIASSTAPSGANAFRLAVRCGRHFGSEPGLRQHVSAMHAPPGTWLCRTCSTDCVTSQARTQHERSCGVAGSGHAAANPDNARETASVAPSGGPKSGVGKKKSSRSSTANKKSAPGQEEKDPDGSFRVPGYRGVWINKAGKHFVKIDGKRYDASSVVYFDNVDDAGRKFDEVVSSTSELSSQKIELNFKPDGSRIVYEDIGPASTSGLGGSASSVVPALSVINIKDLPPDVKPLLRDPRQTSRTGGNSKRHVYAYRGVCRQARKGHDRWQSQISFMGQNHYLGTFDSEWDAAAIYAWAHLILYGEEATRQAQKEGEEAAAAYEQEKRDIAAGIIPAPAPKPEKKKKPPKKKEGERKTPKTESPSKRKTANESNGAPEKKKQKASNTRSKASATSSVKFKENITPILAKGVAKAPLLARREMFVDTSDEEMLGLALSKLKTSRRGGYIGSVQSAISPAIESTCPCVPPSPREDNAFPGIAMLIGISPTLAGWDLATFVEDKELSDAAGMETAVQMLAVEYDEDGANERFSSIIQGYVCIIGCANKVTQRAAQEMGLDIPVGGSIGTLDCHIGGVPGSCEEESACIQYAPTGESDFRMLCLSDRSIVTVNGEILCRVDGSVPLRNGDVCSVGARVFSFVVAEENETKG